jgi:hypothetical protein
VPKQRARLCCLGMMRLELKQLNQQRLRNTTVDVFV